MYFNYTKYNPIVFKLQNTNYFCQGHKIQNTKYFKCIQNTYISITCISITPTLLIVIIDCCGKHCELLLNRFLIKDLHHILNLLRHLPFSSIIDDKIRPPPTSFSTPCVKKISTPLPLLSTPPPQKNLDSPTSILTIRSLGHSNYVYFNALICIYWLVYNKIRD